MVAPFFFERAAMQGKNGMAGNRLAMRNDEGWLGPNVS